MQNFQAMGYSVWGLLGVVGLYLYVKSLYSGFKLLRNGLTYELSTLRRLLFIELITIPVVAVSAVNSTFGGFGPGAWMWLAMVLALPIFGFITLKSLYAWRIQRRFYQAKWVHLCMAAVIVNGVVIAPYLGEIGIAEPCDKAHQLQLRSIIEGMEHYRASEGRYPLELGLLIPEYVTARPQLPCFGGATDAYRIEVCDKNTPILVLENYTGGFPIRYYPPHDKWSSISFLDGTCSFLD